jgi:hypothetical protein
MELYSKYGEKWELTELLEGDFSFILPKYSRVIYKDEFNQIVAALDPPGGPMINVGDLIGGNRRIIEIIELGKDNPNFIIKTEKEELEP